MGIDKPRRRRERQMSSPNGSIKRGSRSRASQNGAADPAAKVARYTALALDAAAAGDQVQSEHYHQQAEYHRKILQGTSD